MMFAVALVATALAVDSPAAANPGEPVARLAAEFEQRFEAAVAGDDVPGATFALVHDGALYRYGARGYTDLEQSHPIRVQTVFRVASLSKGFAGILAALLAEEGHFSLADPVVKYVPEFRVRGRPTGLTVGDVLGQRTGFTPNAFDNLIEAGIGREEIHTRLESLEPICPPGSCYTYQNGAFSLVEPVLELATGQRYSELVAERIFRPLGMNQASIGYEAFRNSPDYARPHVKRQARWHTVPVRSTYYQVESAAGVNASILDMARWSLAILGHYPDTIPPQVVNRATTPGSRTLRDLRRRHWRQHLSDAHYGLGWRIYHMGESELIYHGGWVSGFRAEISLSPGHDLGLVILLNAESSVITELTRDFWSAAFEALGPAAVSGVTTAP